MAALTLESDLERARTQLHDLDELGINLEEVTRQLLDEGIEKFADPYDDLIRTITEKKAELITA